MEKIVYTLIIEWKNKDGEECEDSFTVRDYTLPRRGDLVQAGAFQGEPFRLALENGGTADYVVYHISHMLESSAGGDRKELTGIEKGLFVRATNDREELGRYGITVPPR